MMNIEFVVEQGKYKIFTYISLLRVISLKYCVMLCRYLVFETEYEQRIRIYT